MLVCAFFFHLHTRPRVQRASGIPCSLFFGGTTTCMARAPPAARTRTRICCLNRIKTPTASLRGALATKQSISPSKERMDCFAALAMTTLDDVPHHPPLPRVTDQRDIAVDAVHELAIGQGDEQRKHHAEMQRQQRPHRGGV